MTKLISYIAAKPKSSRKRKKASINFNPESSKKRTIALNKNSEDDLDNDFIVDDIKNKKPRHGENTKSSSELSLEEDQESNQHDQLVSSRDKNQTRSTISSTNSSTSKLTVTTPEVIIREGHYIQNEGGFQIQSDKAFIQQQVQLLGTAFSLQDCPGLASEWLIL